MQETDKISTNIKDSITIRHTSDNNHPIKYNKRPDLDIK